MLPLKERLYSLELSGFKFVGYDGPRAIVLGVPETCPVLTDQLYRATDITLRLTYAPQNLLQEVETYKRVLEAVRESLEEICELEESLAGDIAEDALTFFEGL